MEPLEHVITNVLEVAATDTKHPYRAIFTENGINEIDDFIALEDQDLRNLEAPDEGDKPPIKFTTAQVNTLKYIKSWFFEQDQQTDDVMLTLTRKTLSTYRRAAIKSSSMATSTPPATAQTQVQSTHTSTPLLSSIDHFRRGAKRDMKDFKLYKEKKQWNQWHRTFVATARAQGLNNVLDHTYTPTNKPSSTYCKSTCLLC